MIFPCKLQRIRIRPRQIWIEEWCSYLMQIHPLSTSTADQCRCRRYFGWLAIAVHPSKRSPCVTLSAMCLMSQKYNITSQIWNHTNISWIIVVILDFPVSNDCIMPSHRNAQPRTNCRKYTKSTLTHATQTQTTEQEQNKHQHRIERHVAGDSE